MLEPLPSSKDPGVVSRVYESQVEDADEEPDDDDDDDADVHDQLAAHPDCVALLSVVNKTYM